MSYPIDKVEQYLTSQWSLTDIPLPPIIREEFNPKEALVQILLETDTHINNTILEKFSYAEQTIAITIYLRPITYQSDNMVNVIANLNKIKTEIQRILELSRSLDNTTWKELTGWRRTSVDMGYRKTAGYAYSSMSITFSWFEGDN